MVVIIDHANVAGMAQAGMALIPTFVLAKYLRRNKTYTVLGIIGAIAVALPLSDAHKFATLEVITFGMYVWYAPMLFFMLFIVYRGITEKHNKSSNLAVRLKKP